MGADISRPVHPPDDWGSNGTRKSFEIISPVSDISNPSDINKLHHRHRAHQRLAGTPLKSLVRSSGKLEKSANNNHADRRVSRTVTNRLPVATKMSRNSSGTNPSIPAPTAFYFPTKESERDAERAVKSTNNNSNKENRLVQNIAKQGTKKKAIVGKKLLKRISACLDDRKKEEVVVQLGQPPHLVQATLPVVAHLVSSTQARLSSTSRDSKNSNAARDVPLRKFKKDAKKDMESQRSSSDGENEPLEASRAVTDSINVVSMALHREEDYFNRLSLSPKSIPAASPFVSNGKSNRVTAILERPSVRKSYPETNTTSLKASERNSMPASMLNTKSNMVATTPVSQLLTQRRSSGPSSVDTPLDTPVSDLFSVSNCFRDIQPDVVPPARSMKNELSPVSSLMRFYTKSGPMGVSPHSYSSCVYEDKESQELQVFVDEHSSFSDPLHDDDLSVDDKALQTRHTIESSNSMYTKESNIYDEAKGSTVQILVHPEGISNHCVSYTHFKKSVDTAESLVSSTPSKIGPINKLTTLDEENISETLGLKMSKLESLFRPILPALSTDDARSVGSFDSREIKVTESAPGVIQSSTYITLMRRESSLATASNGNKKLEEKMSPSQVSIDTQPSPGLVSDMVSKQAKYNAEFLFASDCGPIIIAGTHNNNKSWDGSTVSISTAGARSRLTQRSSQAKEVKVSESNIGDADVRSVSDCSYKSERRVRFSADTIETKAAQLSNVPVLSNIHERILGKTDEVAILPCSSGGISSLQCSTVGRIRAVEEEENAFKALQTQLNNGWVDNNVGNENDATPLLKRRQLKHATKSPFVASHSTDEGFVATVASTNSFAESIDLPDIESKESDLTDNANGSLLARSESKVALRSSVSIPGSIPEEEENEPDAGDLSPDTSLHWTYNENGVTPFVRGKANEKAAKSPVRRFKDAKNRFSATLATKSPKNVDTILRARSRSCQHVKTKRVRSKGSGGLVSARIEELNSRVAEIRKIKRMMKKMTNPRLHTHNFDNKQPVRNRALLNYKTSIKSADIETCNSYMAAKFNVIPDVDEDSSAISSLGPSTMNGATFSTGPSPTNSNYSEGDDVSKLSNGTCVTNKTDGTDDDTHGTGATVATVVQQRDSRSIRFRTYSGSTSSTATSGFSKVRNQVLFRASNGTQSLTSSDESTTLSAIIHKENEFFPPAALHLSPNQRTPMQAMKWRSLAAAVAEKDARSAKKMTLGARNTKN